jgi:tRNA threonylcarbamoyladenosine biosynthesis protein TsaE
MMRLQDLTEAAVVRVAAALAAHVGVGDIICLSGPLGAGKTTFARGLLHGLGLSASHEVPSPTYILVSSYAPPDVRLPVAHIDLYRLESEDQVQGLGLDDMMDDHLLLVEWPERWGEALPAERLHIDIVAQHDRRTLTFEGSAAWMRRISMIGMAG